MMLYRSSGKEDFFCKPLPIAAYFNIRCFDPNDFDLTDPCVFIVHDLICQSK